VELALLLLCIATASVCAQSRLQTVDYRSSGAVQVSLKPKAIVTDRLVRVADIAAVEGGNPQLRERIADMDLDDPPSAGQSKSIPQKLVEFRLQVAGIDKRLFEVHGNAVTVTLGTEQGSRAARGTVVKPEELTKQAVFEAARQCVLSRLPWESADIEIRLFEEIADVGTITSSAKSVSLDADLRTAWPPIGRVGVGVVVSVDGQRRSELPVHLEVRHFDNVVVSKRPIEANRTINEEDVYLDRREVSVLSGYSSSLDSLVGTRTRRSIRPLTVITAGDVTSTDDSPTTDENTVLIRRQDRVRLVGRTGALSVSVLAEALQEGRAGDLIRLRNIDSNKIVMGRVVSRNEVVAPF